MPGVSGVTVVTTLVCFFISHTRLRALSERPAFPAPSDLEKARVWSINSGAVCVAGTRVRTLMLLRANGSRERAPDDRLREASIIAPSLRAQRSNPSHRGKGKKEWIASSQGLLAMTKSWLAV